MNPFANPPAPSPVREEFNVKSPPDKGDGRGLNSEFETRRSDLRPVVRNYADRVYASIKKIYKKYGVKSVAELHAKIAAGKKPRGLKPGELKSDSAELSKLVENLKSALERNAIPESEGTFVLHDVPSGLPTESVLTDKKTGFKFDWILKEEYSEGRHLWVFWPDEDKWQEMGFDDPVKRKGLVQEIADAHNHTEKEREARVFDISETIAKKKTEDPDHPVGLTTKEVFEAIDEAGYRPAILEELLAFGKEFWKPDEDSVTMTEEKTMHQLVSASYVSALGSPFTDWQGDHRIPCINWDGDERNLSHASFTGNWGEGARFLVVRKTFA